MGSSGQLPNAAAFLSLTAPSFAIAMHRRTHTHTHAHTLLCAHATHGFRLRGKRRTTARSRSRRELSCSKVLCKGRQPWQPTAAQSVRSTAALQRDAQHRKRARAREREREREKAKLRLTLLLFLPERLQGEVQQLLAELQARDRELNDMSNSHAQQLETWVSRPPQEERNEAAAHTHTHTLLPFFPPPPPPLSLSPRCTLLRASPRPSSRVYAAPSCAADGIRSWLARLATATAARLTPSSPHLPSSRHRLVPAAPPAGRAQPHAGARRDALAAGAASGRERPRTGAARRSGAPPLALALAHAGPVPRAALGTGARPPAGP